VRLSVEDFLLEITQKITENKLVGFYTTHGSEFTGWFGPGTKCRQTLKFCLFPKNETNMRKLKNKKAINVT
jgi:hypothetical protein